MNTHIRTVWTKVKQPILVGLSAIAIGAVLGLVFPPAPPRYACPAHLPLRAHFLERYIAFGPAEPVTSSSSSSEALRPAAPVEPASSAAAEEADAVAPAASSASSASSQVSASSSAAAEPAAPDFPAFGRAVFPVGRVPNWGAMTTSAEWDRSYDDMKRTEFVRVPSYDLAVLTIPTKDLLAKRDDPDTVAVLTAKLFYSTRHFGSYDLDAGEFTGDHAGIDLKVPKGTPVVSVAGGRVSSVRRDSGGLGIHVIVEHRLDGEAFYAIYGHLDAAEVREGQDVSPGDLLGRSGSSGRSVAPHLHLQIDRGAPGETPHEPYQTDDVPDPREAGRRTVHPIDFIEALR